MEVWPERQGPKRFGSRKCKRNHTNFHSRSRPASTTQIFRRKGVQRRPQVNSSLTRFPRDQFSDQFYSFFRNKSKRWKWKWKLYSKDEENSKSEKSSFGLSKLKQQVSPEVIKEPVCVDDILNSKDIPKEITSLIK